MPANSQVDQLEPQSTFENETAINPVLAQPCTTLHVNKMSFTY